ncbi:MAG: hypothetical protein IT338_14525 [Thermomicrobiales bacterium]|nr:hypothetical protein [Thermomicrobiales bacterium]
MVRMFRSLPNTVWWITVFFATLAFFTQIAIGIARSGAVPWGRLLLEFALTLALLAIPVAIAWRARQQGSLWYAFGALVLLVAMARIFFM